MIQSRIGEDQFIRDFRRIGEFNLCGAGCACGCFGVYQGLSVDRGLQLASIDFFGVMGYQFIRDFRRIGDFNMLLDSHINPNKEAVQKL